MKIVILGSNAAGMSFAAKYKRNNPTHEVIAFEKRDYVSFGSCGLPYFVGGFFEDKKELFARSVEDTIKSGIDLRINSEVINIDFETKVVDYVNQGNTLTQEYDKLIITTGANPIIPNFGEFDQKNFSTLTTMEDGHKVFDILRKNTTKKVAIIGGGFIGLEMVEACHHLGLEVVLIEGGSRVMANQVSEEFSKIIQDHLVDKNVEVRVDTQVSKISDNNQGYKIDTSNGEILVDAIVCAVGFRPNTSFINLDKLTNGAIITDQYSKTSVEDVYAIGDCATVYNFITKKAEFIPLATTANKQARMVADYLSGNQIHLKGMIGSSCIKIMDLELATTGPKLQTLLDLGINAKEKIITDMNHTSYLPNQSEIKVKFIYDADTLVLYGCEMIGNDGVVGRLDAMVVAITNQNTTQEIGYMDFCYAPPYARTWDILNVAGNVAK